MHRPSTWLWAELKKHEWSKHSWLFLTESRNSINAQGYQPFTLSWSIYSCSTGRPFQWNRFMLSWLTSFTRTLRKEMLFFYDLTVVWTTASTCSLLKYRLARSNTATRGQTSHQMGRWSGYNMPAHFVHSAVGILTEQSVPHGSSTSQHSFCSAQKKKKKTWQLCKWTALMELFSSHLTRVLYIKSLHLNTNHLISHIFFFFFEQNYQCEQLTRLIFRWQAHALINLTNSPCWCLKKFFMHGRQHGRCIRSSAVLSRTLQAWQ